MTSERWYRGASIVLFVVLACIILFTFRDYGITWDEPMQNRYGSLVDRYYFDLLHGKYEITAILNQLDFAYYGGLFDSLAAGLEHISPLGEFETRHLLNAIVGLLGVWGCWKVGRLLGGWSTAFWAALLLVLTPRFYGHMFNNPKDLPFAVGFIWTLYYLLSAIPLLPRVPWKLCLELGSVIGLTLGVRVGAILLITYVGLVQITYLVCTVLRNGNFSGMGRDVRDTVARFGAIVVPAWCIMLVFWPWAAGAPFTRPFKAFAYFNAMPWHGTVLFQGNQVEAAALPRTYTLQWFGITLPEGVLILLILAVALGLRATRTKFRSPDGAFAQYAFLAFAIGFPLAYVILKKPVLYDAERHSLYLVPPLICLCAATWTWVLDRLFALRTLAGVTAVVICLGYLGWQASVMVRLHPQEYVYFNNTIGGLPGAYGRYETDYWGNSYHEAVNLLVNYVRPERQKDALRKYRVFMTSTQRVSASYYFPPYFSLTSKLDEADFFLATTRYNIQESVDGCVVAVVERFGVPLAIIKDRRCSTTSPAKASRTAEGENPSSGTL